MMEEDSRQLPPLQRSANSMRPTERVTRTQNSQNNMFLVHSLRHLMFEERALGTKIKMNEPVRQKMSVGEGHKAAMF